MQMEYRHTQIGTLLIVLTLVTGVLVLLPLLGTGNFPPEAILPAVFLTLVLLLFGTLTIEVKYGSLRCWFGVGLIRKRISLSDVVNAKAVRNPWYVGWGIRWVSEGYLLWNVSGLKAVDLTFKSGKRFRLGTDEPDALIQAIEMNRGMVSGGYSEISSL